VGCGTFRRNIASAQNFRPTAPRDPWFNLPMKKADRITQFVEQLGASAPGSTLDPHYAGFFTCFNEQRYYEAHDVLEHLWLQNRDENHAYFKGLIQVAGAFVHLQKQFLRPEHPKDGRRLRPATRLFALALKNLAPYRPQHMALDVGALCALCTDTVAQIVASDFTRNPWHPEHAPRLTLSTPKNSAETAEKNVQGEGFEPPTNSV
jgi:Domain of unknown function (DUF309)